jgi:hypothetical protein
VWPAFNRSAVGSDTVLEGRCPRSSGHSEASCTPYVVGNHTRIRPACGSVLCNLTPDHLRTGGKHTHCLVPGKPISTHAMTQKLNRHGISVRAARNSALAALAADLPSPILADLTGMHRHTAIRWVAYARRDWAEYLAARAEDQEEGRR